MNIKQLLRLRKLLLLGWLLAAGAGTAAPAAPAPVALPADHDPAVRLRQPPAAVERLNDLRGQRAFDYHEKKPDAEIPGFWGRFGSWLLRKFGWMFNWLGDYSYDGFWRWVIYGLLGGAVVFVVLKLLQVDLTAAFGRAPRRAALDYETGGENIHELDFATLLREAEDAGQLRLAVRLGYLALLKQLSDQSLIDWQPDKTNQTYLRELAARRPPLRSPFAELTRQFEYVWYGELPLSPTLYADVRTRQRELGQQLGGTAAGRARAAVS
ncbi:MAG: DUF4129 domain-containing protein [Cytophagaceae bacterium]|nr:MAG: DUF4129 domain-containing protein [Cytophagaceae bacterium]